MADERVPIPGSAPVHASAAQLTAAPPNEVLDVTIMLRRPSPGAMAADPNDLAAVRSFVQSYGLQVVAENPDARTMKVQGTAAQMQQAFGVALRVSGNAPTPEFVTYQGSLTVPKQLDGVIIAVLGLDRRPVAKPRSVSSET
ncbi:MAG TPA: protease pro-enzyme activation domain-containing protein [Bryobacteraceae bacterium]|nr:protease pro-enzyme activation domain-containing protein [Bryobacteraceae bacterium]